MKFRLQIQAFRYEELKTNAGFQNKPEKFRKYKDHLVDASQFIMMLMTIPMSEQSNDPNFKAPPIQQTMRPEDVKSYENMNDDETLNFDSLLNQAKKRVSQLRMRRGGGRPISTVGKRAS